MCLDILIVGVVIWILVVNDVVVEPIVVNVSRGRIRVDNLNYVGFVT